MCYIPVHRTTKGDTVMQANPVFWIILVKNYNQSNTNGRKIKDGCNDFYRLIVEADDS